MIILFVLLAGRGLENYKEAETETHEESYTNRDSQAGTREIGNKLNYRRTAGVNS